MRVRVRFSYIPVSEVMTLPESMSESVSEVLKNLMSESESEAKNSPGSESVSESTSELMSELMSEPISLSEPTSRRLRPNYGFKRRKFKKSRTSQIQSERSKGVKVDGH